MPDLIRHPESIHIRIPGFRLGGRKDKSQSNNPNVASPEGEGFQPSPIETLKFQHFQAADVCDWGQPLPIDYHIGLISNMSKALQDLNSWQATSGFKTHDLYGT